MLEFNIRNQEISRIDNFSPAEKSVKYLIAKFNFKTEDWNGATKRAIFRNVKSKMEKDTMLEDDSCIVPWEVLVGSSDIEVSVHGVIDTEDITTNVAVFNLDRTLSGGSASQEPTPTVYEQMLKEMQETKNIAQSVRDDADAGKFGGGTNITVDSELSEESTNPVQNKVITAEVIALRERNAELEETIEKLQIKTTTEPSPFHHITDSANMKVLDFGMKGITEQRTTSGKNYYSGGDVESTNGGKVVSVETIPAGTYTISANVTSTDTDSDNCLILLQPNPKGVYLKRGTRVSTTFTTDFDITGMSFYTSNNNANSSGDTATFTDIQIEPGEVATEYEPHTGNQPSPNPDYEQPITLAGVLNEATGRYEHKCCVGNKNLFDWDKVFAGNLMSSGQFSPGGQSRSLFVHLKPNTTYTFSQDVSEITNGIFGIGFLNSEVNPAESFKVDKIVAYTGAKDSGRTFTTDATTKTVVITFVRYSINEMPKNMQLEEDSSATDYVEPKPQNITLTSPVPLTKWDKLVKRDGVWGWSMFGIKLIVDNKATCGKFTTKHGFQFTNILPEVSKAKDGYCNQFTVGKGITTNTHVMIGSSNKTIYVLYTDFYDESLEDKGLSNWKSHLAENPLEIWTYADEEQAFHPLPDEEQTLLNNLETYYGVTNVYNEQGCPMWIKYVADTKLYVDKKLLEIQSAII